MGRILVLLLSVFCAGAAYVVFARTVNPKAFSDGHIYTDAEKAMGMHCQALEQGGTRPVQTALQARIGSQDSVRMIDLLLGPLRPDGTHKMTLSYEVDRIGQPPRVRRATGSMTNADCSFTITTLER